MIYHVRGGNFCSLGTWGGYQPGGYINGENVIVKLSEDGYPPTENTKLSYKFNSCFADVIEPNDDGTDTYTVKVANGRHLQNLNFLRRRLWWFKDHTGHPDR